MHRDDPPAEEWDDRYPAEADLLAIEKWAPMGQWSGCRPWLPVLQLANDAWNHDMGRVLLNDEVYTFVTGGWSGNEDIIAALGKNFSAYSSLWLASYRGGKHEFGVRND
jgi:hypothetical protein